MENASIPTEWEQFLYDVRDYFKASLETSEYENTSNLFFLTAAEATEKLLTRCEKLLMQCTTMKQKTTDKKSQNEHTDGALNHNIQTNNSEDPSYLDMTGANSKQSCEERITVFEDNKGKNCTINPQKTIEVEDDQDIYDICHVSQRNEDETQKVMSYESQQLNVLPDCPYTDLSAANLSTYKSTKYGQLQRIEKRLFFDQTKKYFCGILNDWLLCYADGPTAAQPSSTLYLKSPNIEIEHSGEGKRREICFQITTGDPNKKFVFQANNEVDAKEWIHAIEAAIRGDSCTLMKNNRKLPTPPMAKKLVFMSAHSSVNNLLNENSAMSEYTCIYEEPSPIYQIDEKSAILPPQLPDKLENTLTLAEMMNYDVPKSPPQPIKPTAALDNSPMECETVSLLNTSENNEVTVVAINTSPQTRDKCVAENSDKQMNFQAKVKDVHNKLSSQLAAGPKKTVKKNSWCDASETVSFTSTPPTVKDEKKAKKTNTPTVSPQKSNGIHSESAEKSAKNWFLNRLNKSSGVRNSTSIMPNKSNKQSEKENLLNGLEMNDNFDCTDSSLTGDNGNPTTPKSLSANNTKSKVNMIINQFETNGTGHMFSVEALASNAIATFSAFCESNDCGNYEPIMTVSSPTLSSFMKKV